MAVPLDMVGVEQDTRISVSVVRSLVNTAECLGIPRHQLLGGAEADLSWLEASEAWVPCTEVYRVCEAALAASREETLALRLGACHQERLPVVSQLALYAATLRQAFSAIYRFNGLLSDRPGTRLFEDGEWATLECLPASGARADVQRFLAEFAMVGLYRLIQAYCSGAPVQRVVFAYNAPDYRAAYSEVFSGTELFGQSFTGIVFHRAMLDVQSPYHDADIYQLLYGIAEQRNQSAKRAIAYSVRVHEVLARHPMPHRVSIEDIAEELELSARSLRRRLAEEGASFRGITKDACAAVALRLFANDEQRVQDVAETMGFSNSSSFYRAFKQWTGTTPRKYLRL